MSLRKKASPDALTDDEIAFLRSDRTPASIRQFAARQHESIGVRTSAYRKIASAARAERDALIEVAALSVIRGATATAGADESRVQSLETANSVLADELERTRRRLQAATAAPAMIVHGER